MNKINLIGHSFDKTSGQGVYKYSEELYEELKLIEEDVVKNESGKINHIQQPELIWKNLFKKNVVTTIHDVMPIFNNERHPLVRIHFYFSMIGACLKSKKLLSVSNNTKKDIIKYFPFARKKIITIYEGADHEKFYPIKHKKNKKLTIGYIGGLGKRKNVEFILQLAKFFPEIKFIIGGKGPQLDNLKKLKENLQVENVLFTGFIEDSRINEFYNSLDLFIFPSFYEGFGLPVIEAMACGVPCLVSDMGSLPEIVENSGIILNIGNINKSVEVVNELIKNNKMQKNLSKKSIERAKQFTWKKCAKETLNVYEGVLR